MFQNKACDNFNNKHMKKLNSENINEVNVNIQSIKINNLKNEPNVMTLFSNKLLNLNKECIKLIPFALQNCSNNSTKKLDDIKNKCVKLKEQSLESKNEIKNIFHCNSEKLIYEIDYFFNNPIFNYDFVHQKDNNFNYHYINENFIDILLLSRQKQLILNRTIKSMKFIQTDITYQKRNIIISWLTELDMKYLKNQNILFLAVKFLDQILYKKNIDINEFQIISILCLNLATKLEDGQKVMRIDEIISLTTNVESRENNNHMKKLTNQIKKTEMKICNLLDFDLNQSTCLLILHRLIQIIDIKDKNIENIFKSISYFFLEISLYDEEFYAFEEFTKALSSIVLTKLILGQKDIKIGFHKYLKHCILNKKEELKKYLLLCQKNIRNAKNEKYFRKLLCKYQMVNFNCIINSFLSEFINKCYF